MASKQPAVQPPATQLNSHAIPFRSSCARRIDTPQTQHGNPMYEPQDAFKR